MFYLPINPMSRSLCNACDTMQMFYLYKCILFNRHADISPDNRNNY